MGEGLRSAPGGVLGRCEGLGRLVLVRPVAGADCGAAVLAGGGPLAAGGAELLAPRLVPP